MCLPCNAINELYTQKPSSQQHHAARAHCGACPGQPLLPQQPQQAGLWRALAQLALRAHLRAAASAAQAQGSARQGQPQARLPRARPVELLAAQVLARQTLERGRVAAAAAGPRRPAGDGRLLPADLGTRGAQDKHPGGAEDKHPVPPAQRALAAPRMRADHAFGRNGDRCAVSMPTATCGWRSHPRSADHGPAGR